MNIQWMETKADLNIFFNQTSSVGLLLRLLKLGNS